MTTDDDDDIHVVMKNIQQYQHNIDELVERLNVKSEIREP